MRDLKRYISMILCGVLILLTSCQKGEQVTDETIDIITEQIFNETTDIVKISAEVSALDERELYYQYIQNELIPQYGLASLDSAFGIVTNSNDSAWFHPEGIVSAYIADFDQDNQAELLLFYFKESEMSKMQGWEHPGFTLYAAVYKLQNGIPYQLDEVKIHAYNGAEVFSFSNHSHISNLFISLVPVEDNQYIVIEFTQSHLFSELNDHNYWGLEFVNDRLQFAFSFSKTEYRTGIAGPTFTEYRFKDGTLISEEPVDMYDNFEDRIKRFFNSFGIAVEYKRDSASIVSDYANKERILSYQFDCKYFHDTEESSFYEFIFFATDYTNLKDTLKRQALTMGQNSELLSLNDNVTKNKFFFQNKDSDTYKTKFTFLTDRSFPEEVELEIIELLKFENGIFYEIRIPLGWNFPERYYYDWDRFHLGYFYVQEDKILLIREEIIISEITSEKDIIKRGQIICQEEEMKDSLKEDERGMHRYILAAGNQREYHSYNNLTVSGFYETFVWQEDVGLVFYCSGFGAESDGIELYIENFITEKETANSGDWQNAYIQFLREIVISDDYEICQYALRDINSDGIPELIIFQSDMSSIALLEVYSFKEGAFKTGEYPNVKVSSALWVSDNPLYPGLFDLRWGGGIEHYGYITIDGSSLVYEYLWFDNLTSEEVEKENGQPEKNIVSGNSNLVSLSEALFLDANDDDILEMFILGDDDSFQPIFDYANK